MGNLGATLMIFYMMKRLRFTYSQAQGYIKERLVKISIEKE
jgi:hypothetical protein